MRSGDVIRDAQGNTYQVGQILGRGLWGTSYLVRREVTDTLHVLKVPIGPDDFRTEVPGGEALFAVTREALNEQSRLYDSGQFPFLPRIEARFLLQEGQPAYLIPRYPLSLERRLAEGMELGQLFEVLLKVGSHVRQLTALQGIHGNLRASNIFFNERGDIILTDAMTPVVRRALPHLVAIQPIPRVVPPEVMSILEGGEGEIVWNAGVDTYALALLLLSGVLTGEPLPPLAREGISRTTAIHLKNRITERLKQEESNHRFHQRLADRACVLLSRALSRDPLPSPPYRFNRLDEFLSRLDEVSSLVRPRIHTLGKVLIERTPSKPWFTTDEAVSFSCTVGATAGVEGDQEVGVGVAVFDLDKEERVRPGELSCQIDRHPSGRYRFQFGLHGLHPGRFRARLAFTIREAADSPSTTEIEFQIRPAAGWKPPAEQPPSPALNFPGGELPGDASRGDALRGEAGRGQESRWQEGRSLPKAEPLRPEPQRSEPQRPEPQRSEVYRSEPQRSEPHRSEPHRPEPLRAESARLDSEGARQPALEPMGHSSELRHGGDARGQAEDPHGSWDSGLPRESSREVARESFPRLVERLPEPARPAVELGSPTVRLSMDAPRTSRPPEPRVAVPDSYPDHPSDPWEAADQAPEIPPPSFPIPRPKAVLPPVFQAKAPVEVELTEPSQPFDHRAAPARPPPRPVSPRVPPRTPEPERGNPRRNDTVSLATHQSWTQLPLPPARNDRPLAGIDEEPSSAHMDEDELDANTSLLERVMHTFRNDSYTLVMSVIALLFVILLAVLFYTRQG